MMTLILNDEEDIKRALKSLDMMSCLWGITEYLRDEIKYHDKPYDPVLEKLGELMDENNVSFEELYH